MQNGFCSSLAAWTMAVVVCSGLAQTRGDDDLLPTQNGWTIEEVGVQTKPNHKFRGRMFFDQIWMEDLQGPGPLTPRTEQDNFTGFDTIRLGVTGNIYENLKYVAEFEFEGNEEDYKAIYAEFQNLPWLGHCRIGHHKEPFGLEELTSTRYLTFMERSCPTVNFTPARNMGVMFYNHVGAAENLSWYVGVFRGGSLDNRQGRGADGNANSGDSNDWSITGRAAWLPYYDEATAGRCLLHCGLGLSARRVGVDEDNGGNGQLEGFLEMDSRDGPIDTRLGQFTEFEILGTELSWMRGPLNITNEFYFMDANNGATPWGTYVEISYFLTGENRGYKKGPKVFDRVKVYEPFFAVRTTDGVIRGRGAWQLKARWSHCDLSDPVLLGEASAADPDGIGIQNNFACGVNWYLNSYCRIMLDYVHSISDVTATTNAAILPVGDYEGDHLGIRYQIDW